MQLFDAIASAFAGFFVFVGSAIGSIADAIRAIFTGGA